MCLSVFESGNNFGTVMIADLDIRHASLYRSKSYMSHGESIAKVVGTPSNEGFLVSDVTGDIFTVCLLHNR